MTKSRFASWVGFLALIAGSITGFAGLLPPKWAQPLLTVSGLVLAFNERIQGGLSTASNPTPRPNN